MAQVVASRPAVKIEDPDEPFLKQAGEIAFEFINLRTSDSAIPLSSATKAPHYPKKTAGEPGLLRSDDGSLPEFESPTTPTELPASLPQLGEGQQPRQAQAQGGLLPTAAAGQPQVSTSREIAERLRMIGDTIDKDITDETKQKLLNHVISAFTVSREHFTSTLADILTRFSQRFPSGWSQISLVYQAMFETIMSVREEAHDIPTATREQQIANFVGPTLVDLGLAAWMTSHGGMENFGNPVEGEDAKAVINDSSVDPED